MSSAKWNCTTPYSALWFEVQFHFALLNYWGRNPERVRSILRWIETSEYSPFTGHPYADRFRWLAERVGYPVPSEKQIVATETEYGTTFTSAVASGNVFGTQFHPEKSGDIGLKILANFAKIVKR